MQNAPVQIRPATADDAHAIADLHAKSWRIAYRGILPDAYLDLDLEPDRQTDWQQRFSAPAQHQHVIVAEDRQGQLAGFACAYGAYDSDAGTLIENLHAHPDRKKSGVGKALLRELALWHLEHFRADPMHLWVVNDNTTAIAFYLHMGGVNDQSAIWDAPGGIAVPELRFTWRDPNRLV